MNRSNNAGHTWKWSEEAKARHSAARKGKIPKECTTLTHGYSQTRTYNSWKKMMARCYKESDPYYHCYGGRGIKVCEEWHDAAAFCSYWIDRFGDRPKGMSLERLDVDGDYSPANCTWIPMGAQSKNRRPWKHSEEGLDAIRQARRDSTGKPRKFSEQGLANIRAARYAERGIPKGPRT